ncbi:MAG TPA: protein kinase [Polyangiaceae bacterium]|nr:protein kinase [Polyangiaceae bacterium]
MTAAVREGDIVAQRYRIERMLGVGGMGVVMAATHTVLHEKVAIKLLLPELAKNEEASKRFVREARAAARVKSEHIARVTDVGALEDGTPFMVMEYLEGETLAGLLEQRGRLPVGEAIDYVLQACRALAAAHDKGIVHRDLKPSNLFLARQDDGSHVIKVLDFGISKVNTPGSFNEGNITKTSAVMGSPNYMSPEQMRSTRTVDGRSDIWSLGVSLYELIAGDPPFMGQSFPEVCLAIAQDPPVPLRKHVPEVPAELEAVVFKCLEKDPERRFAKVSEFARALLPFAPQASHSATATRWSIADEASVPRLDTAATTPSLLPSEAALSTGSGRSPAVARTGSTWANTQQWQAAAPPPPRKGRAMMAAAGLMGVAGAAIGVWLTWRYTHTEVAPRPAPTPAESATVAKANDPAGETPPPSAPSTFASNPPTIEPTPSTEPVVAPLPSSTARPTATGRPPPPGRPPRPPAPPSSKTGAAPNGTAPKPPDPPSSADPFGGRK